MPTRIPERPSEGRWNRLTPRVWQVTYLYANPKVNKPIKGIASELELEESTVSTYLKTAVDRLGLSGRHALKVQFISDFFEEKGPKPAMSPLPSDCAREPCPLQIGGSPPCRATDCPLTA